MDHHEDDSASRNAALKSAIEEWAKKHFDHEDVEYVSQVEELVQAKN